MIATEKLSILEYPRIARDIRYWHVLRGFCVEYQDITPVSVLIKSSPGESAKNFTPTTNTQTKNSATIIPIRRPFLTLNTKELLMAASDDVNREFNRQSYSEQKAIATSWESFLAFASRVIKITLDVIDIIMNLYQIIRKRY